MLPIVVALLAYGVVKSPENLGFSMVGHVSCVKKRRVLSGRAHVLPLRDDDVRAAGELRPLQTPGIQHAHAVDLYPANVDQAPSPRSRVNSGAFFVYLSAQVVHS